VQSWLPCRVARHLPCIALQPACTRPPGDFVKEGAGEVARAAYIGVGQGKWRAWLLFADGPLGAQAFAGGGVLGDLRSGAARLELHSGREWASELMISGGGWA